EAGLGAVLLLGSVVAWGRLSFPGALFLGNLAAYGAGRWGLELTRESVDRVGAVRLHRAISAGLMALAGGGFLSVWLLDLRTGWAVAAVVGPPRGPESEAGPRTWEWSFVLAPLGVLAVLALFRFVGCNELLGLDETTEITAYLTAVEADAP